MFPQASRSISQHLVSKYERDTKRTYPFTEESENPIVGTLYVQKHAFKSRPDKIEVTLKAKD